MHATLVSNSTSKNYSELDITVVNGKDPNTIGINKFAQCTLILPKPLIVCLIDSCSRNC